MTTTARGKALRASPFAPYEFDHKKRKEVTEQGKAYTYPQPTITASASTPGSRFKRRGGSVLLRRGQGDGLKRFKQGLPDEIGEPLKFAPKVILWTEMGAARHAKMLTTDKAWDVFEEMEDAYFRAKETAAPKRQAPRAKSGLTRTQAVIAEMLIKSAAERLKLAPSAVLGCYQRLESMAGVPGLLPAYAIDAPGGSSEETKSAAELLEIHGIGLSAIAFNRLLMWHGFLAERERPSSKGGTKKFKVCTDLEYGKNLTNPNNPRETQPHWYVSKFAELLELVHQPQNVLPFQAV